MTRNLRPAVAAIGGTEEAASRPSARDVPEVPAGLPEGRKQHTRIARIHRQIDGARVGVSIQHFAPGPSAVARSEDPALIVGAEYVAKCGDIDEIGVQGMDADAADEPGSTEAQMAPGPAGIRRFVNAVAVGYVEPYLGLPGADIDHVGVRGRHGERTDRGGAEKAVAHATPIDPAIHRFPHASGAGAEIEDAAVFGVTGNGDDAAAPRRPDAAPFEGVELGCRAGGLCHQKVPLSDFFPATLTAVTASATSYCRSPLPYDHLALPPLLARIAAIGASSPS